MADILHRIGFKAPIGDVYRAISTIDGLAGWWTQETTGSAAPGGKIAFIFRTPQGDVKGKMEMKVQELLPNQKVHWRCLEGPADWIGTDITFDLTQQGEDVILIFGHRNWKEAGESLAHCSMKWATFLLSLKQLVLTGRGQPSPQDLKIDNWN